MTHRFPGIDDSSRTDLPVLHSFQNRYSTVPPIGFSAWLAAFPPWVPMMLALLSCLWPLVATAQSGDSDLSSPLNALMRWIPLLLLHGFSMTVIISVLTMLVGTLLGAILGIGQVSRRRIIRWPAYWLTQIFRNSPWLVLLFIVMLSLPFEITLFNLVIPFPDWIKAIIGLALPIMANISEIVRGAIRSVPNTQWEAAESLAFTRYQTMSHIIFPQCIKRMIPPWMNWYAILTMATPVVSILGVEEILNLTRQAIEAEGARPELLVPFYVFVLLVFFAYCYPIARLTVWLERRYAFKT